MQDIREKWRRTVNERYFRDFSIGVEEEFRDVTAEAQSYWDRLVKHETRDYLWEDLRDVKVTAGLTKNFFRLRQMAIALHTPGSRLEGSEQLSRDVIGALDWVIANRFNVHIDTNGNWWDWEIGVPSALTETILLMSDSLSRQQVEAYLAPVDRFTPDPNTFLNSTPHYPTMVSKGANRVWICRVIALRSLILEDEAKLLQVRDALSPLFEYVTEGEGGFCPDGSFLQHGIPYTGGYGKNLIGSLVTMVRLLDGSPYAVSEMQKERMYEWVYEAYSPLIFRGSCMDMANGREASRHDLQNHEAGHAVIRALLELSIFAPTEHAARIQGMVKYWILQDKSKSFLASTPRYLQDIAVSLLQDEGLPATAPAPRFKMFGSMARAVQQRAEYAFGISMFSKRVAAYESINGENKKGWYTGHGHTSLYNRDLGHYSDGYWPTVDPYRLAGITVTDEPRADSFGNMYRSGECWAGGVQLQELYGSASMALEDYKSGTVEVPLRALKSWFMFEGEIVALGSNICYDGPFQVETIVENRKLNHQGNNQLIVNGVPMPDQPVWSSVLPLTQWMHLQGDNAGDDIGYYFPTTSSLLAKRETRTGRWSEIGNGPDTELFRNYATVWFHHGTTPQNESYAYVILPGITAEEMVRYADEPSVKIIEQSSAAHAVQHTGLGILGVNFWTDQTASAAYLTCTGKASVMANVTDEMVEVAISDPTHENSGTIELELQLEAASIIEHDPQIEVMQLIPAVKLRYHAKATYGGTSKIRLGR